MMEMDKQKRKTVASVRMGPYGLSDAIEYISDEEERRRKRNHCLTNQRLRLRLKEEREALKAKRDLMRTQLALLKEHNSESLNKVLHTGLMTAEGERYLHHSHSSDGFSRETDLLPVRVHLTTTIEETGDGERVKLACHYAIDLMRIFAKEYLLESLINFGSRQITQGVDVDLSEFIVYVSGGVPALPYFSYDVLTLAVQKLYVGIDIETIMTACKKYIIASSRDGGSKMDGTDANGTKFDIFFSSNLFGAKEDVHMLDLFSKSGRLLFDLYPQDGGPDNAHLLLFEGSTMISEVDANLICQGKYNALMCRDPEAIHSTKEVVKLHYLSLVMFRHIAQQLQPIPLPFCIGVACMELTQGVFFSHFGCNPCVMYSITFEGLVGRPMDENISSIEFEELSRMLTLEAARGMEKVFLKK